MKIVLKVSAFSICLVLMTRCTVQASGVSPNNVFYVCALGGVGLGSFKREVDELGHFWTAQTTTPTYGTGMFSFGHRWQRPSKAPPSSGRQVVFHGIDFSLGLSALKDTVYDDTPGVSYPASSTLRHPIALAVAYIGGISYQTWSFYGKAGLSVGLFQHKTDFSSPEAAHNGYEASHTINTWKLGPTLSVGASYALSTAWRLTIQQTSTFYQGIETSYSPATKSDFRQNTGPLYVGQLMLGITYLF